MNNQELASEIKNVLQEIKLNNEYTPKQLSIIIAAYMKGLNYKLLLNKNLSSGQMYEVLAGLELNCPIEKYSSKDFSKAQIRTLNYILSNSHNNKNVYLLINNKLNIDVMNILYRAMLLNIDVNKYTTGEYTAEQLNIIINGLIEKLPVNLYDKPEYTANKMNLLYLMIRNKFYEDNINYDEFDSGQLMEIYTGYLAHVDVHLYMNPKFSVLQMRQLRIGQLNGLEISSYSDPSLRYDEMKLKRVTLENERNNDRYEEIAHFLKNLE